MIGTCQAKNTAITRIPTDFQGSKLDSSNGTKPNEETNETKNVTVTKQI